METISCSSSASRYSFFFLHHFELWRSRPAITNFTVRPKVIKVAKTQLKDSLRSYIPRPVIRSVELDEPLEHLTEMRQVVILFINVITDVLKGRLVSLVNKAYILVCGYIYIYFFFFRSSYLYTVLFTYKCDKLWIILFVIHKLISLIITICWMKINLKRNYS